MVRLALTVLVCALAFVPAHSSAQDVGAVELSALESLLTRQVSTVSKYEQRQTDAPAFVSIITHEDIRRLGYQTLADVLQNQVGFYSGNDRDYSDVGVRGLGRPGYYNNKVLLLVDGHPMNDNFTGGARIGSAMPIDMDAVQRIEVVRGPGSSLYGARAMLAVVNMVTRKGRDLDGLEANAEVGAYGARGGTVQYGAVFNADSDLAIQASWAARDGEDIYYPELDLAPLNGGIAEDLDWEDRVRALATFRAGRLTLQAAFSDRDKGVPTAAWRTSFNHPEASSHDRQYFAEATLEHALASNADVTVKGGVDGFDNVGRWPFSVSIDSVPDVLVESRVEVRSARGEARLAWEPGPSQRVVFGVEGVNVFRASLGVSGPQAEPDVGGRYPYNLLSGFVHQEFQITDRLALTLGIRRDQYSTIGGATTPRAALVFHGGASEATTLKLLFGEAFRAPNLMEMYTTSIGTALVANPDLNPEKVRTVEAVWEQHHGNFAGTASVFRNEVNDLIDLVQVDIPATESEGGRVAFQQQNIAAARAQGVEVELRGILPGGLRTTVGYAFTDAKDTRTGDRLVNSPRHTFRASATASVLERIDVGVSTRAEGRRSSLYGTETDPVAVTDLTLGAPLSDRFTVQASLRNVFDRNYSVPGGFQHVQSVIPQPHRFLSIRLAYGW